MRKKYAKSTKPKRNKNIEQLYQEIPVVTEDKISGFIVPAGAAIILLFFMLQHYI